VQGQQAQALRSQSAACKLRRQLFSSYKLLVRRSLEHNAGSTPDSNHNKAACTAAVAAPLFRASNKMADAHTAYPGQASQQLPCRPVQASVDVLATDQQALRPCRRPAAVGKLANHNN
jgi:hypothetical protein